jgi:hypothetical protein
VEGAGHFRTPVGKGIEIIEGLRGHTSGYAVPTYVVDAPGGGGKIPVMPNYQISMSDHKIILRNYEGYITTYEEPVQYQPHDPKTYAALVIGAWPASKKVIDVPLHKFLTGEGERRVRAVEAGHDEAKRSITLVKVAHRYRDFTLLDVTIKTGRTHQIRVHLTHEGHPIVGDAKYGDFTLNKSLARGAAHFERMFLHARRLRFQHPASGEAIELESPLPAECEAFLATLA